jgi:hypothetical protein
LVSCPSTAKTINKDARVGMVDRPFPERNDRRIDR